MSQQPSYEQFVLAEVRRRDETDYRFSYGTYIGWSILTIGFYYYYGSYKLIQRRVDHAQRRLAFQSYLWHTLSARAEAAGKQADVAEGLDNLSRIYQQMEAFERSNKREPVIWPILRFVLGYFFGLGLFVGPYVSHFLNKDLLFYEEWESSFAANAEWVMQRLGYPVTLPQRTRPVKDRNTVTCVLLSIVTLSIYGFVWRRNTMYDGNGHFDDDAAMEDAIVAALGVSATTTGGYAGATPPQAPSAPAPPPSGSLMPPGSPPPSAPPSM